MSGVIGIGRMQKGGEIGAGWRGAGGHAYSKLSQVRAVQCWATSDTESSPTLVPLSGGGVIGERGKKGEEESERGQRQGAAHEDEGRLQEGGDGAGWRGVARVAMLTSTEGR